MVRIGLTSVKENVCEIPDDNRYYLAVRRAGAEAVWLPWSERPQDWAAWAEELDGFLFTGGGDIDPKYYGEEMDPACGAPSPARDTMEMGLIAEVRKRGKPVLGICRGCQTMNVALGGTLIQNIPQGGHSDEDGRYAPSHPAEVFFGTVLAEIIGEGAHLTNSIHHQAVNRLGEGLTISAKSPDGIVEGIERPGEPFFLAVQFHPEATAESDPKMQALFDRLAREAEKQKER